MKVIKRNYKNYKKNLHKNILIIHQQHHQQGYKHDPQHHQ